MSLRGLKTAKSHADAKGSRRPKSPVPRGTLCASFRRTSGNGAEVYISYLRRDLAAFPLKIVSVRGKGYALLRCAD